MCHGELELETEAGRVHDERPKQRGDAQQHAAVAGAQLRCRRDAQRHGGLCKRVLQAEPKAADALARPRARAQRVAQGVRGVRGPEDGGGVEALQLEERVRVEGQALQGIRAWLEGLKRGE